MRHTSTQRGFTLVELIMVIVIMGVIGGMVSVFMRSPIDAYVDSARRAALTDVADTAVRRMARDIRKALPNSLRQSIAPAAANNQCIEFIPTMSGGRYRAEQNGAGGGDILDFTIADTGFDMLGANNPPAGQAIAANDFIAVYNLGIPGSDAYAGENTALVTGVAAGALANETNITIAATQFPLASGSNRFHVIPAAETMVSYVCNGGSLWRRASNVATTAATNVVANSCSVAGATLLANNVAACNFVYNGSDLQRNGLVQLGITFTDGSGETINLYHEVHVSNAP
jgi:MSHA biogenesis protein MshO